jgi:hypothetical protein
MIKNILFLLLCVLSLNFLKAHDSDSFFTCGKHLDLSDVSYQNKGVTTDPYYGRDISYITSHYVKAYATKRDVMMLKNKQNKIDICTCLIAFTNAACPNGIQCGFIGVEVHTGNSYRSDTCSAQLIVLEK